MHLSDLKHLPIAELVNLAIAEKIENTGRMRKQDLIFALLKNQAKNGQTLFGSGTLEVLSDGFGFLRSSEASYLAGPDDIYVSPSQIRRFNLHTGDTIEGEIRTPKELEEEVGLTEGNIFQGELTMDQLMFNRPIPGYAQYKTPIKNLYMCGSSTHPGGGVMGAPGANAAREILIDLKKRINTHYI